MVVMATKKFLLEVEEGRSLCPQCPLKDIDCSVMMYNILDCSKYNLATMKIKELGKNNENF